MAAPEPTRLGADVPLRLGVIGLGPRWRRRYEPAVRALRGRLAVAAVCDPQAARARLESRRLECALAAGPTELLDRPDVDALLLADRQWYGLWPVEAACRAGKPVFCGDGLAGEGARLGSLVEQVNSSRLPVMVGLAAFFSVALDRLRELLASALGPPRLLLASRAGPAPAAPGRWGPLLLACGTLLEGEPQRVLAVGPTAGSLQSLVLDYGKGRSAQLTYAEAPTGRATWHLQLLTERGSAVAGPGWVRWRSSEGELTQVLGRRRVGQVMLEAFGKSLQEGTSPRPSLADVGRLLGWLRGAARSGAEGRWVDLDPPGGTLANAMPGA